LGYLFISSAIDAALSPAIAKVHKYLSTSADAMRYATRQALKLDKQQNNSL